MEEDFFAVHRPVRGGWTRQAARPHVRRLHSGELDVSRPDRGRRRVGRGTRGPLVLGAAGAARAPPGVGRGAPTQRRHSSSPLERRSSRLIDEPGRWKLELPREVGVKIVDAAEGNQLFVEEMLFHADRRGLLVRRRRRWRVARDLESVRVLPAVGGATHRRLDQLGPFERAMIEEPPSPGRCSTRQPWSRLAPARFVATLGWKRSLRHSYAKS